MWDFFSLKGACDSVFDRLPGLSREILLAEVLDGLVEDEDDDGGLDLKESSSSSTSSSKPFVLASPENSERRERRDPDFFLLFDPCSTGVGGFDADGLSVLDDVEIGLAGE